MLSKGVICQTLDNYMTSRPRHDIYTELVTKKKAHKLPGQVSGLGPGMKSKLYELRLDSKLVFVFTFCVLLPVFQDKHLPVHQALA